MTRDPYSGDISSDGDDPVMHAIVDRKGLDRMAVASSRMRRFETEFRAIDANVAALAGPSGHWIDPSYRRPKLIIRDMDSSESPSTGNQGGSAYAQRHRDLGLGLAFVTKESLADRCGPSAPGRRHPEGRER